MSLVGGILPVVAAQIYLFQVSAAIVLCTVAVMGGMAVTAVFWLGVCVESYEGCACEKFQLDS